jgi:hypothetical protein
MGMLKSQAKTLDLLNRLLAIVYRSLPMFVHGAAPWTRHGDEKAVSTLEDIVIDQEAMVKRIAELILDRGGVVANSEFPMDYAEFHMLSMDYMLTQVVIFQRRDVAEIDGIVSQLSGDTQAQELAQETLGSEKAHLEALESLVKQLA